MPETNPYQIELFHLAAEREEAQSSGLFFTALEASLKGFSPEMLQWWLKWKEQLPAARMMYGKRLIPRELLGQMEADNHALYDQFLTIYLDVLKKLAETPS